MFSLSDDAALFVCEHQYGGQEHLNAPPRELLLAQTEDYMEYSRHGAVIKGQEKAVARSKYEEDVLINNHTVRRTETRHGSFIYCRLCSFCLHKKISFFFKSVSGALTGWMASGVTSAATPW